MGGAMIAIALDRGLLSPEQIVIGEILPDRRRDLEAAHGVRTMANNREAVAQADVVVLAIKPQVLPLVLPDLSGAIQPHAVVLSIVAGARLDALVSGLQHPAVVRAMPNTPAQIGQGMAVWTATPQTSEAQCAQAEALLKAMGQAIQVRDEKYLDMATAVSGSGPAYWFLFLEAMIDAAVHLGFSRADARTLVLQTALGSVLYARQSEKHLAELRNMVTSPGGTTAEALAQLEASGVRAAIDAALWAAYEQSRRLGKQAAK